jgi:hypothetical protein
MRTALWQSVKRAFPDLTDTEVDHLLHDAVLRERQLVVSGTPLNQAREIVNEEMFEGVDPWVGDDRYGQPVSSSHSRTRRAPPQSHG